MSDRIPAGAVMDAASLTVIHELVDERQIVAGAPTTGVAELDGSTGVLEMSPGAMRDIEVDELFIVLAGDATVDFVDPVLPSMDAGEGSLLQEAEGTALVESEASVPFRNACLACDGRPGAELAEPRRVRDHPPAEVALAAVVTSSGVRPRTSSRSIACRPARSRTTATSMRVLCRRLEMMSGPRARFRCARNGNADVEHAGTSSQMASISAIAHHRRPSR